ncbi:MAG: hypothetical protein K8823_1101 [Cenarchaeum symbiont of Oopsacas minuta]|nr:hypothetical protein [Cenarchaeum symbiont of Oopsacas minuta]
MCEKIGMGDDYSKYAAKEFFGCALEYMQKLNNDDGFASEIAYVMTTLHMHGA